ncbi:UDP-N-acetylmuramate dehydrogenase [Aquirufa antheringensis]|jgi:UDP-N-acetylmuramate dehydrogenase|uniref:UDP-N-acetylenolpyruvoylglucosamine reductase n=1 Tax=Aquirufa antheringensis TaxID=2516559 RepID=A0A4Q9BFQ2_9BACT|nr:UDP-N-acetylmuramate dehydrogenase [Aquirufa antheringensis]MCZ2484187.1 UDP-N-acetylmuramate dehydrogenase [Aquirufa antheringensis]MCZ2487946.1 UDP-N-acetylmuramate dehydrogenase [Aquirufa antheringensis]MCZ2489214.1 UDP-N-acetylmuramate dehydrogenase [Aquirufa antheringensis]TBH74601.1 UDP-N-acetylmuramate dehydrogenase [Aquirufa antheringensis]USQ03209.1 UDP-N-acetylmuramate dehydrogenase [Aquirufa antheringensis]
MFSLRAFNTFGIEAEARQFVEISSIDQYVALRTSGEYAHLPHLFLGGGSNVLLTQAQEALIVKISIPGISVVKEDADFVWLKGGAGVVWDEFVQYAVNHGWSGLENLSLIPGTVGAAPMQNIGAYGAEIKDTFDSLEALNLQTLAIEVFDAKACAFGYRESFFKRAGKGLYLIGSVTFKLSKKPSVKTSYGAIQEVLATKGITQPSIRDVADAVIEIRKSKLPDPKEIGNSGSFFKNPTVSASEASRLMAEFPGIPNYPVEGSTEVKFPAGWFIEKAGWKGFRRGDAGVHAKQALVLVNYGEATGAEILALSEEIKQSIKDTFGVSLETEVNIL